MNKIGKILTLRLLALVLSAVGISECTKNEKTPASQEAKGEEKGPVEVYVRKIEKTERFQPVWFVARIRPKIEVDVQAVSDGRVVKWFVKPGDKVVRGQKLVSIRASQQQSGYLDAVLTSDVQGEVGAISKRAGEAVKPGDALTTVWNGAVREVEWTLRQEDADSLKVGSRVEIFGRDPVFAMKEEDPKRVVDYRKLPKGVSAVVSSVSRLENRVSGGFSARASLDCGKDKQSCAGLPVRSWVRVLERRDPRLLVEIRNEYVDRNEPKVYLVTDKQRAKEVKLELGESIAGFFEVKEGLAEGDLLITSSSRMLKPDVEVKITEPEGEKPSVAPSPAPASAAKPKKSTQG